MRFWNLIPDDSVPEDGVLDIEGPIGTEDWYEDGSMTGSRLFKKALQGVRNVTVHINSPGGDVMAGAEIYSALREHSMNGLGKVTVIVTALAASAASLIAMAGDEILMSPVAYMMIHNPWSMAVGDAKEMRKIARTLDEITEGIITAYQRRTGKSRDQLKRMLENETYMSAQTAVDEGFADGVWGGEIRASAMVTGSMMGRATPEAVKALCERWEKAHEDERKVADSVTLSSRIVQTADAIVFSVPSVIEGTVNAVPGIAQDAEDDPEPEEAAGADGQDRGDGSSVLATDEPSPGPARDDHADGQPEAFDREAVVARAAAIAAAMKVLLNG